MERGGRVFAVIASEEGDHGDLLFRKIFPLVFADEPSGFLVMRFFVCGSGPTSIVEEGGDDEEFLIGGRELMEGLEFTKKKNRPESDVLNVSGFAFVFFHEGESLLNGGRGGNHRMIFLRREGAIWSSQTP
jgi:hypothetical protein